MSATKRLLLHGNLNFFSFCRGQTQVKSWRHQSVELKSWFEYICISVIGCFLKCCFLKRCHLYVCVERTACSTNLLYHCSKQNTKTIRTLTPLSVSLTHPSPGFPAVELRLWVWIKISNPPPMLCAHPLQSLWHLWDSAHYRGARANDRSLTSYRLSSQSQSPTCVSGVTTFNPSEVLTHFPLPH